MFRVIKNNLDMFWSRPIIKKFTITSDVILPEPETDLTEMCVRID